MRKSLVVAGGLALCASAAFAQLGKPVKDVVELELLTTSEVVERIKGGAVNVLVVNGGTEARGPQNILGGHTIMSRATAIDVAKILGQHAGRAGHADRRRRHRGQRRHDDRPAASPCPATSSSS